ncbi:hypothetical protein HMPREF0379_0393 [[Eubacterium] yurii subsp. margaretiae ATCC 43715]|nr:hypothetical protein HMPREF0379_0393 [[Eubacterium] yurii subsp. margaretiae ATCC 43715]
MKSHTISKHYHPFSLDISIRLIKKSKISAKKYFLLKYAVILLY